MLLTILFLTLTIGGSWFFALNKALKWINKKL